LSNKFVFEKLGSGNGNTVFSFPSLDQLFPHAF
jgi:hypothetical protein